MAKCLLWSWPAPFATRHQHTGNQPRHRRRFRDRGNPQRLISNEDLVGGNPGGSGQRDTAVEAHDSDTFGKDGRQVDIYCRHPVTVEKHGVATVTFQLKRCYIRDGKVALPKVARISSATACNQGYVGQSSATSESKEKEETPIFSVFQFK